MTDELKPCPFCSHPAELIRDKKKKSVLWYVSCLSIHCSARGPFRLDAKNAADDWNKRPVEDALQNQVDYWKEMVDLVALY